MDDVLVIAIFCVLSALTFGLIRGLDALKGRK